jgi:transcription initiation factor TFIIH subunit 2
MCGEVVREMCGSGSDIERRMEDGDSGVSYAWESSMKRTWETVKEDQEGNIITTSLDKDRLKRSKFLRLSTSVRRGLIRYIVLFLDCSISSRENDFKPTRFDILKKVSENFITNYFDQNPISQLSVAISIDRSAEKITDLSGNSKVHLQGITNLMRADGLASLQNILLLAMSILRHIPDYGCREVIILYTSLSTCDPGDIFATIEVPPSLSLSLFS